MKNLAELANASKATVSKAFSGSSDVSKEARDSIGPVKKILKSKNTSPHTKYKTKNFKKI